MGVCKLTIVNFFNIIFFSLVDFISDSINQAYQVYNSKTDDTEIIISVCCGTAGTELNSDKLCLCLDKDKRSLHCATMNMHSLTKKHKLFQYFDYGKELYQLFCKIKEKTNAELKVLFQHPSPAHISRDSINIATEDCTKALLEGIIQSVHVVYDYHIDKHTWDYMTLCALFSCNLDSSETALLDISDPLLISELDCILVQHPLFGETKRLGWALMKRGEECCFNITKK